MLPWQFSCRLIDHKCPTKIYGEDVYTWFNEGKVYCTNKDVCSKQKLKDDDRKVCYSNESFIEEGYYIKDDNVEKCSSKCKTCASGSDNSCTSCNWDRPYLTKASTDTVGSCELKCNHYRDEIDSDIIKCYTDDACPSNMNKFEEKRMCYSNF